MANAIPVGKKVEAKIEKAEVSSEVPEGFVVPEGAAKVSVLPAQNGAQPVVRVDMGFKG